MSDISITKFRVQIPRNGSIPSTPGFAQSEGQDPVNPPGSPTGIYVPYLGATGSVDLGEFGLATGYVKFDTTPTNIPTDQGTMYWDEDDETVALIMNGAIQKVGEDSFYPVKNQTGSNIAMGVAVRFAGTVGNSGRLLIELFLADGTYPSSYFMGVTMEAIDNGENGKVMWFGRVRGINTNAYNEGDILYASTTVAGGFQTAVPQAPNNIVQIAAVVTKSATVGTIFIRPTLGSNINKDEGVKITSGTTGDLLQLQSNGLWENKSLATVIGTAYVPSTRTLTINGTAFDLSANRSWSVGTVTSVGLTVPTGLTVANSPVTGSGTLAISLQSGYSIPTTAKQTEWDTAYTNRITSLTTTGSSGAATLAANVLNIPNYTLSGLGGVPTSRTLTINGTVFDLSANRSWSVGTVTSVAALTIGTTGTDISSTVANGTSTPVITLNIPTASATNRGALSAADWTTFNNKQAQLNGTGFVKASGTTISYDNSTYYLASNPAGYTTNTGTVTSVGLSSATSGVTIGSTPVTTSGTITIAIATASGSQQGLLSSTDWTTFNNKQNALTNPVTGTGTTNQIAYFTGSTTIGSLSTATYPSLTELSYVKGVTSGIQAQLNGKEPTLTKGNLTEATSSVLTITGGTGAVIGSGTTIQVKQATSSVSGFLSSTDWTTFNAKIGGTIASGQVAFGTGAGTIAGDSGLTWNNVNKRLGIGTTSPVTQLTLERSSNSGSGSDYPQITLRNSLTTQGDGSSTFNIASVVVQSGNNAVIGLFSTRFDSFQELRLGTATNHSINFLTGGLSRWQIVHPFGILQSNGAQTIQTSSGVLTLQPTGGVRLATSGGNVLIGTTSDSGQRLQVNGDVKILDDITVGNTSLNYFDFDVSTGVFGVYSEAQYIHKFRGGASGALNMGQYDVNGNASINNTSNAALIFGTNNTARLTITAGGNIEIANQIYNPVNAKGNSGTGTVTFNWNDSNIQTVTLTGNCTFAFSNPQSGASYQIIITQDGTGGRTITWPAGIYWEGKTIPTLTGTANSRDIVTITYDGSNYNALIARNFGT